MEEIHQAFVMNPIINQYKKKYILGVDGKAAALFRELCTRRVYIDAFIDDENAGIHFFHKPVHAMQDLRLDRENSIVLAHNIYEGMKECAVCSEICILNPQLYGKKVIIYGLDYVGKKVQSVLKSYGVDVLDFVDSDKVKSKIALKDKLNLLDDTTIIVEAGNNFYEMDNIIKSINENVQRFFVCELPFESKDIWVDWKEDNRITSGSVAELEEYCEHEQIKEIILYGNDLNLAQKYAEIYKCLDFGPITFMTDKKNSNDLNCLVIDEIIYKDNYLLLLYEKNEKKLLQKLYELDLDRRYLGKASPWESPNFNTRDIRLDVNLGHMYETDCEYPGIYVYGMNQKDDYKIAVLGGSTADSGLDSHIRSWVEILFDEYCKSGITVFNGAAGGYYSGQELIKMIRDMMKLSPDMILVYDGYNDLMQGVLNKRFKYLKDLVNFSGKFIPAYSGGTFGGKEAWDGFWAKQDPIDGWLENIEYMHSIANSKGINFFSFMQPMLFTKKNLDQHSKTIFKTMLYHGENEKFMDYAQRFRDRAEEIVKRHSYIYDLSHIFDEVDVYIDIVHVYEKGNKIIAKYIWDIIKDSVEK